MPWFCYFSSSLSLFIESVLECQFRRGMYHG
jgi:hypothetical protein